MWYNFFDKIFLINLKTRTQRLFISATQLNKFRIPFEVWEATEDVNGQLGIYLTLMKLFAHCMSKHLKNVLVLEDDLNIIFPEINYVMPKVIEQLPDDYLELRLGANIPQANYAQMYSDNLLIVKRMLSLHAVAYSRECMEAVLSLPKHLPVDISICNWIQPNNKSYCTYPLLISQRPGYSDIEGRQVDYRCFIEERFERVANHLKLKTA